MIQKILVLCFILLFLSACTPLPTSTPTAPLLPSPTRRGVGGEVILTATASPTATLTSTATTTPTPLPTATATATRTETPKPTATATIMPTPTPEPAKPVAVAPLLVRLPWSYERETDLNSIPLEVANARADDVQAMLNRRTNGNTNVTIVSPGQLDEYMKLVKKGDFRGKTPNSPIVIFEVVKINSETKKDPVRGGEYVEIVAEVGTSELKGRFYLDRPVFTPIPNGGYAYTATNEKIVKASQIREGMKYGFLDLVLDKSAGAIFINGNIVIFSY